MKLTPVQQQQEKKEERIDTLIGVVGILVTLSILCLGAPVSSVAG